MLNMRCLGGKYHNNNIAIWILFVYFLAIFITRNVLTQVVDPDPQALDVDDDGFDDDDEDQEIDPSENAWCFRFTWLGPKYDKNYKQFLNQTCKDVIGLNKGIPCVTPLVVTNNSNYPDTDWIWNRHYKKPADIACKAAGGDICAKYSYFFNGRIENITYMCTKVNIENGSSPTSGCFKESKNNRVTEVCVCEPRAGMPPCNSAISPLQMLNFSIFGILTIILVCIII